MSANAYLPTPSAVEDAVAALSKWGGASLSVVAVAGKVGPYAPRALFYLNSNGNRGGRNGDAWNDNLRAGDGAL